MCNVKGALLALFAATSLVACGGGGGSADGNTSFTSSNYSLPAAVPSVPDQSAN